ncbi:serine/threonine-protein kinase [Streptomyces sp. ME02-8801-2C]|uniref:serine/threonine-protein kinase n=1 Tax=Streptomyces sp. ME02-8801-2C TaxID=3028680 RepID=UPI0029B40E73|nr:serine/threonine-protein kinase [Streptomyces sp. ME02-8801-2C]MDX3454842.1 serine/threonine-protein kinase [Streptomyces sp. ME02-8801-2C]
MSDQPGSERVIAGRYRLLSPLGEGGMGTVWLARDEVLHREVAVKEVRAPAGLPTSEIERLYARLEREAWAAARVSNRNVVTVYDVANDGGRPWIVMEVVRGLSLADQLDAEGPLPPQRAAHIGAEVLSALRAAHEAGVLHRDVKPANVLLSNDGRVVLTDFGIATVEGSSALTMTGEVIGSPEFLAPERALGRTPGPESDLWSLGVLLYAAVEGNSPFRQNTPLSTLRAIVDEELPPPRRAGPLTPVIEGLLRKDPAERIAAAQAEHDLRIIGAGGTLRAETGPTAPYAAPTIAAAFPQHPTTPPLPTPVPTAATRPVPPPPPPPSDTFGTRSAEPDRNRRAAVVLVAGLAAVALAVAGLTYALLNGDNGTGDNNADVGSSTSAGQNNDGTGGASSPKNSPSKSADEESGSPSSGDGGRTSQPAQSVEVQVTGSDTDYSGSCPPPNSEAPGFTATFTVGNVPTKVSYRWVTEKGAAPEQGWRTLSFPAGGDRTKQNKVYVTTYDKSGTIRNAIGVEVREPVSVKSNTVPFSVTCEPETETETPTDGASSPASTP